MKVAGRGPVHTGLELKEESEEGQNERARSEADRRGKDEEATRKVRQGNRSSAKNSLHKAPWGIDQRQFSTNALRLKQAEIEAQRSKRRQEREKVKRQGRTRIGLDLIPDFKYPSKPADHKPLTSPPHHHAIKETDPAVVDFMLEKRRRLQTEARQRAIEEQEAEERRAKALARLQSVQKRELARTAKPKRKKKKQKKKPPVVEPAEPTPCTPGEKNLYKKLRELLRTKAQQIRDTGLPVKETEEAKNAEKHASLLAKMEQLSAQLARTKLIMSQSHQTQRQEEQASSAPSIPSHSNREESAALLIQHFFRRHLHRRKARPPKCTEKTLQLSEVDGQAEEKEKELDLDLSLKSFGSFLDRREGEKVEEEMKRQTDSLDFLARENHVQEEGEYAKEQLVDHFRKSLDDHYLEIDQKAAVAQPPPAEVLEEPSLLNTLRSSAAADEFNPSPDEDSLGWDQNPVPPAPPSPPGSDYEEEKAETSRDLDPRPTIAETGGSPNDSSLPEDQDSMSPFAEAVGEEGWEGGDGEAEEEGIRLAELIGDSPRSLVEFFEPKVRFVESGEPPQFQPTSLRIPTRSRFTLDMAQVVAKVSVSPSEDSPSIGTLIRSGPESPEVLSFREQRSIWQGITSEKVDFLVESLLNHEISNLVEIVGQFVTVGGTGAVDASAEFIIVFLERLMEELLGAEGEFMEKFNRPRKVDMHKLLSFVATAQVGVTMEIEYENLVPEDVFQRVCESLGVSFTQVDESSFQAPYCRLLVEVVNEALNILRPEGERGEPPAWREGIRDSRKFPDLLNVMRNVRDLMIAWSQAEVGKIIKDENAGSAQQIQENHLSNQLLREVLTPQVILQDASWTNYETEETQVKLDLGDFILTQLIDETLHLLSHPAF